MRGPSILNFLKGGLQLIFLWYQSLGDLVLSTQIYELYNIFGRPSKTLKSQTIWSNRVRVSKEMNSSWKRFTLSAPRFDCRLATVCPTRSSWLSGAMRETRSILRVPFSLSLFLISERTLSETKWNKIQKATLEKYLSCSISSNKKWPMFAQSGQRWLTVWPSWTNRLSPSQCSSAAFHTALKSSALRLVGMNLLVRCCSKGSKGMFLVKTNVIKTYKTAYVDTVCTNETPSWKLVIQVFQCSPGVCAPKIRTLHISSQLKPPRDNLHHYFWEPIFAIVIMLRKLWPRHEYIFIITLISLCDFSHQKSVANPKVKKTIGNGNDDRTANWFMIAQVSYNFIGRWC